MRIYWYAPFNNAFEVELAEHVRRPDDHLTFHSLVSHVGMALPSVVPGCTVVRDLPDTPGDDGEERTDLRRFEVAFTRARRRHKVVTESRFDVTHLHTYNLFLDPIDFRRLRRKVGRLIVSVHNVRPHDPRVFGRSIEARLLKLGYRLPHLLVVAHPSLATQLVEDFDVPAERIHVVPLPVATVATPTDTPVGRTHLFFGTLRDNKGVEVALEAMKLVRDPEVRLHFAGRGTERLENLIRAASAADPRIVAELGYVSAERQDELFREASTVVLPYTSLNAQSGVLGDAYAYRRPVIASSVGGLGPDVRLHGTGRVVEPFDSEALADALSTLDPRQPEWVTYSKATEAVASQRSLKAVAAQMRRLYDLPL